MEYKPEIESEMKLVEAARDQLDTAENVKAEEVMRAEESEERRLKLEIRRLELEVRRLELEAQKTKTEGGRESSGGPPPSIFSRISDISASAISAGHRHLYDVFTPPCTDGTFIPNRRLRLLVDRFQSLGHDTKMDASAKQNVSSIELLLKNSFVMQQVLGYPTGGGEARFNDLNLQAYVNCIILCANALKGIRGSKFAIGKENGHRSQDFILASKSSKPEYFIYNIHSKCIVLGTEAKGTDSSHFVALPQFLQLCADSALTLRRRGLATEDCVIPGVIAVGETFQIAAVYLMPDHFPVLVNVSSPIPISDTLTLSIWAEELAIFANDTMSLLMDSAKEVTTKIEEFQLATNLFFKPIRLDVKSDSNGASSSASNLRKVSHQRVVLHHMMKVYHKLILVTTKDIPVEDVIQFPLGVISVPSIENTNATSIRVAIERCVSAHFPRIAMSFDDLTHTPCLVFPYLSTHAPHKWTNKRPESNYVSSYLEQLSRAVLILNSADVVHMDLRHSNIMWRVSGDNEVAIQIIDFEDSLLVGQQIPEKLIQVYSKDPRYPISYEMAKENVVIAKTEFNDFFLHAISAWLNQSDYETDFHTFMLENQNNF